MRGHEAELSPVQFKSLGLHISRMPENLTGPRWQPSGLRWWCQLGVLLAAACLWPLDSKAAELDGRGDQFIGFEDFKNFTSSAGHSTGEQVLTSPEITARIDFDQLVTSWNAEMPEDALLKIEVQAIYPEDTTGYYAFGLWSGDPQRHPRQGVAEQKDASGNVATDTLVLVRPCRRFRLRLTISGAPRLKFLGVCLANTKATPPTLAPNRAAWGQLIEVPERSQMVYTNGSVLCSPTTLCMLMAFWAKALARPELELSVPEIEAGVYDPNWQGTGNWSFNMAFAGSYSGLRAYVSRFSDVSELEDWIAKGLPVGLSLCYNRLRGKAGPPSGHLVVCVGFTETGDVIINDPGTRLNVRKTFLRANLTNAWAYSHNTVYLVYSETATVPLDRFGHWYSRPEK
jgi:hypothetical protein